MSVEAITWALRQPITHSSAKFVLVVLANCASADTGVAFPSTAYLASATGQDRKTVVANLARLIEWGLIEDTGRRAGTTKQIVVYRVLSGPDLFEECAQKRNSSENGTVPKTNGNSTVFPQKESQKRDTEPSITQRNRQPSSPRCASRFEEFWAVYPKKVAKKPTETKWKAKRLDALADRLIADVRKRQAEDGRWLDGYIPNPSTYLAQERWEDELQPRRDAPKASPVPAPASFGAAAAIERSQTEKSPLERRINWIRQQHNYGQIDVAERDRLIAEATQQHRRTETA